MIQNMKILIIVIQLQLPTNNVFHKYIYHLFVAMLYITVVQYEKGERQTQKSAGGKTD